MEYPMRQIGRWLAVVLLFAIGGVLAWILCEQELDRMRWEVPGGIQEYPAMQLLRPILIVVGCLLPGICLSVYRCLNIMDRYMTRAWLAGVSLCTVILCVIFIIADFAENVDDLMGLDSPIGGTLQFYLSQLPMILNMVLPYTLLLGTLWALTKLSGASEITGMLQSGRSLLRITTPVIGGAIIVAIYYGIFGFHWGPNATMARKLIFSALTQSKESQATIYKNDATGRIWYLGKTPDFNALDNAFIDVRVEQFSAPGKPEYELFAQKATWDRQNKVWTFEHAIKRRYSQNEPRALSDVPQFDSTGYQTLHESFPETPWQLISPGMRADAQGSPALWAAMKSGLLREKQLAGVRTEWHVRIARIFSCVVLAFISIPSAITFQRRSTMTGIGIALFLAAMMLFLYEFCSTLSAAGYLPPWLGAWLPNILYLGIAVRLFQTKLAHRTFKEIWQRKKQNATVS